LASGQPRTYRRITRIPSSNAAYRRLAVAILGLDVATLARELRSVREKPALVVARAA
jgi:hypothetical protein